MSDTQAEADTDTDTDTGEPPGVDKDGDSYSDEEDCDDTDPTVFPGADEVCNDKDDDCDGEIDEDEAVDASTWYVDADGDGFGLDSYTSRSCTQSTGWADQGGDCDDGDSSVSPSGTEVCNGADDDCDGEIDEDEAVDTGTWYVDADGDGFGDDSTTVTACEMPSGFVVADETLLDCDDEDASVYPGADELCDTVDNDCDGNTDDGDDDVIDPTTWYVDYDGDGYGSDMSTVEACEPPTALYIEADGDCDDTDADSSPEGTEVCDQSDNDCDGTIDNDEYVLGDGEACPAIDCLDILGTRSSSTDGAYWLDPDGEDDPFEAYCDMSTSGGGWTLVAKLTNQDGRSWADDEEGWTEGGAYGDTTDLSVDDDARSEAWDRLMAYELMLTDNENDGEYIVTTSSCLRGYTPADFFTLALAAFPYSDDDYFDTCDVDWSYWPTWAAEPDWNGYEEGTYGLSLNSDYIVIARTDVSADTSGVVSFYETWTAEADLGLGSLETGTEFSDSGASQDIGGPTSCNYDDSECAIEYPETVFFWVQ